MSKHGKDKRPYLPPVTRIELSEKNIKLRSILLVVLLSIAVVSIGFGISQLGNVQPGWHTVEAAADRTNYSREFMFQYDFSQTGGSAAAANKALTALYTEAMEESYRIFSKDADEEDIQNLYDLNRHPNEDLEVHEALYDALALLDRYNNRSLYLAPVYVEYNRVFNSESDAEAQLYDPSRNPEVSDYIRELMTYISDENHIHLELLGENRVRLAVSGEYLSYALEQGIEEFLDLGWMRNAFVADYTAERLAEQGFTRGYLASFDGFNRTLDSGEHIMEFQIYDRQGKDIYIPAKMSYTGQRNIVFLKDYPLNTMDRWSYRSYEDGDMVSAMIDAEDGISRSSVSNLVSYSDTATCSEILMEMIPVFVNELFSEESVMAMEGSGIYSVWCFDQVVYYNDPSIQLEPVPNADGVLYEIKKIS